MAVASLMFGTAWVVMGALFRGAPAQRQRKSTADRARAEPALTARPKESLLVEITDIEPVFIPEAARTSISHHMPSEVRTPSETPPLLINKGDIEALAERLTARRPAEGGHRTLITGESEEIVPFNEVVELVRALAETGVQTIVVDWSPRGNGVARMIHLDMGAGLNELLRGEAGFDHIIQRLPGTGAHAVASGSAMEPSDVALDPDVLNLVLDALDEAYDHIVVVGRHDEARQLFESIEGRFDAGVIVASRQRRAQFATDRAGTFLGFDVADIDIIRFVRQEAVIPPIAERITRATQREPIARRA
jgi:hypothetical protein